MKFESIAIIGQSCVLPGSLTPQALWENIKEGKDLLSSSSPNYWRMDKHLVMTNSPNDAFDMTWTDRGGYVTGFENVFDPSGFGIPKDDILKFDPLVHWIFHTAREALKDAGYLEKNNIRRGAIFGNLSYPTHSLQAFSEAFWLEYQGNSFLNGKAKDLSGVSTPYAVNRFMSGLPAHALARALNLDAGSFAIDAACASSLYAIKLACDKLQSGKADLMLAGGVNRADDLIIHVGFCSLQAMSQTGRSRPFHKNADGLVPAEGAGFIALKRLNDAIRDGDDIKGVIRGIGLSNDGRGHGLLVPSEDGQVEAIKRAYEISGLSPKDISLLECHATGTTVGDVIELRSTGRIYKELAGVPIGTVKSNMGHPITASGVAGIIKVTEAMKHEIRPKTLHAEDPNDYIKESPFRLLLEPEKWTCSGLKRAAISNFGFGGNNAHLIIEEWAGEKLITQVPEQIVSNDDIAIIGIGTMIANTQGTNEFAKALFTGKSCLSTQNEGIFGGFAESFDLPLLGLKFFPAALDQTLPQQLIILKATLEAIEDSGPLSRERTGVLVGMGCDAEVTRSGLCWRLRHWINKWMDEQDPQIINDWVVKAKNHINPCREPSAVLGAMPNIVANRLCSQFDLAGPSHTISAEELSGIRCLETGIHALRTRELDTAVIGAVDMSCEPVHLEAANKLLNDDRKIPGDAAITLVIKRLEDAKKSGDKIYAVISDEKPALPALKFGFGDDRINITNQFGHSHAASGLVHLTAAALACHANAVPTGEGTWKNSDSLVFADVSINAIGGEMSKVYIKSAGNGNLEEYLTSKPVQKNKKTASRSYDVHPHRIKLSSLGFHPSPKKASSQPIKTIPESSDTIMQDTSGIQKMIPPPYIPPVFMGKRPKTTPGLQKPVLSQQVPASRQIIPKPVQPAQNMPTPPIQKIKNTRFVKTRSKTISGKENDPMKKLLINIVEHNQNIATLHEEFIKKQNQIHQRFLDMRKNALNVLTGAPIQMTSINEPQPFTNAPVPVTDHTAPADIQTVPNYEYIPETPLETVVHETVSFEPEVSETPDQPVAPTIKAPEIKQTNPVRETESQKGKPTAMSALKKLFENPVAIEPKGPSFDREQLKILASGNISEVFGPLFEQQDQYEIQVRLPEEPLLLADRITGIDAEPGSMGKGIIWTETDVKKDAWYIHDIYMPGGITIESGQCDLTLISYLGIDFLNKGKRAYRLLGCDLMYYGEPPKVGDTLCYQIHVDGHANMGGQRMFFFHYDCRIDGELRLSVRNGQAAFITPEEAASAGGVLWEAETGEHKPLNESIIEPPEIVCTHSRFTKEQIIALSEGRGYDCFGKGFERLATHSKTPKIPSGRMRLLDEVTEFDPKGGPWKRGYIRVENKLSSDDWFFSGHFKNDPCMPGTLMSEGCMQTLAFYLAAMGFTSRKDGWRFDPVPNEIFQAKCRSQVTPDSKHLTYEAFIEEIIMVDGLYPTVFADLVASCDGKKSLHIRRLGIRLVPDWPLDCWPHLLEDYVETRTVAVVDGMEFGYKSIMACAFGKPSDAFGQPASMFDTGRHIQRLPGPPYHFMTRVSKIDATPDALKVNDVIEVEYDVPEDSWYFHKNGNPVMPFCVLLEVALQPCGWLACFEGGPATSDNPLYFRNLDGHAVAFKEVKPDVGRITTRATLINVARAGSVLLVRLKAECYANDELIFEVKETAFGFFSAGDLAQQPGLNPKKEEIEWLDSPNDFEVDLTERPKKYCNGKLRLPEEMLLMLDKVTGYWPDGGKEGKGLLRAEKAVDPNEWFFKAHFFNDPVQPGSLGVEAIIQLAQFYMIHEKMDKGIKNPRFTASSIDNDMIFKYRGQVLLDKDKISSELHIIEKGKDERGAYIIAEGFLWIDKNKIFHVKNFRMDIVSGGGYKKKTKIEGSQTLKGIKKDDFEKIQKKVAKLASSKPKYVQMSEEVKDTAICKSRPLNLYPVIRKKNEIDIGTPYLDFERMLAYSRKTWNVGPWVGEKFTQGLFKQFSGELIFESPDKFEKIKNRNILYLGNHQVQVESLLLSMMLKVLTDKRTSVVSDSVHQTRWTGPLDDLTYKYPGVTYPKTIVYFTQNNRKSMFDILEDFKAQIHNEGISVFIHAEGKLGLSCRNPVKVLSSVFIDLAIDANLPIVPVKFSGGLPVKPLDDVRDFPLGYCKQDYYIGKPIMPEKLAELPYADRRKKVLKAINGLGPSHKVEKPNAPDLDFEKDVTSWMKEKNVNEVQAVLYKALERLDERDEETDLFIKRAYDETVTFGDDEKGRWLSELATWLFEKQ